MYLSTVVPVRPIYDWQSQRVIHTLTSLRYSFFVNLLEFLLYHWTQHFVHVFICISSCYIFALFIIVVIFVFSSFYIEIHSCFVKSVTCFTTSTPSLLFFQPHLWFVLPYRHLFAYLFLFVVWFQANFPVFSSHAYTIYEFHGVHLYFTSISFKVSSGMLRFMFILEAKCTKSCTGRIPSSCLSFCAAPW